MGLKKLKSINVLIVFIISKDVISFLAVLLFKFPIIKKMYKYKDNVMKCGWKGCA